MDTATTPADAGGISPIANDRLVGAEAIGRFIDPNMTPREVRRRLLNGSWPCWKEGAFFVASKAALLAHWREMTAQRQGARQPQNTSPRRGYRPHVDGTTGRRRGKLRRADREGRA